MLGLSLAGCLKFYKYYRRSAAIEKLQRSEDICSEQISATTKKLQRSDNIRIRLKGKLTGQQ